jgi:hypothetical protein
MYAKKIEDAEQEPASLEQRRYSRQTVFKSALLYPVVGEAGLSINNISENGLSGKCALTLGLREQVHVSFDNERFITAEVRWTTGPSCGLIVEDPFLWITGHQQVMERLLQAEQRHTPRISVDLSAKLVTSAPVLVGTVRNMSTEGMMIEVEGLREGARLLVQCRGTETRMGRVQWSSGGMVGIFFQAPNIFR